MADQIPTGLAPEVLKNTRFKVCLNLPSEDDCRAMAKTMAMDEHRQRIIPGLEKGECLVFGHGDDAPIMLRVPGLRVKRCCHVFCHHVERTGLEPLEGKSFKEGDEVLLTQQDNQKQNGVWQVGGSSWTRPADLGHGQSAAGVVIELHDQPAGRQEYWRLCPNSDGHVVGQQCLMYDQVKLQSVDNTIRGDLSDSLESRRARETAQDSSFQSFFARSVLSWIVSTDEDALNVMREAWIDINARIREQVSPATDESRLRRLLIEHASFRWADKRGCDYGWSFTMVEDLAQKLVHAIQACADLEILSERIRSHGHENDGDPSICSDGEDEQEELRRKCENLFKNRLAEFRRYAVESHRRKTDPFANCEHFCPGSREDKFCFYRFAAAEALERLDFSRWKYSEIEEQTIADTFVREVRDAQRAILQVDMFDVTHAREVQDVAVNCFLQQWLSEQQESSARIIDSVSKIRNSTHQSDAQGARKNVQQR